MARYAKVDVRIWGDENVSSLTPIPPCGQGLWIRLLTSPHRSTVPGILCVGEAALAEEFGWTLEAFREAFREASAKGMVKADWKARFLWVPNAKNYNRPESPNVVKSWRIPWDEAPECFLKRQAYQELKAFIDGFAEGFRKAFAYACSKPLPNQEQDPEQEQEQEQGEKASPLNSAVCKCQGGECLSPSLCNTGTVVSGEKASVKALTNKPIRPRTSHELITLLRCAVEKHQPQNGPWNPGDSFSQSNAQSFLEGFSDLEAAIETIEKRVVLFAKDATMCPWTVAKFTKNYNGLETFRDTNGHPAPKPVKYHRLG